jgi:hypothetical protein
MSEEWLALNRALWDERVPIYVASAFYDVDAFLAGASTLRSFELEEVGDVAGLTLLHAQCHFGLDHALLGPPRRARDRSTWCTPDWVRSTGCPTSTSGRA